MKDSFSHCSKCGKNIDELAEAGKYLTRTSPKGTPFVGECAPCCEYHEMKTDGNTALMNALKDSV